MTLFHDDDSRQAARSTTPRPPAPITPDASRTMTNALIELDRLVGRYGPDALLERVPGARVTADLCGVVARLCAEAKEGDARRAERLVVFLRGAWRSLPAVRRIESGDRAAALLDRIVSDCIQAFHRPAVVTETSTSTAERSAARWDVRS